MPAYHTRPRNFTLLPGLAQIKSSSERVPRNPCSPPPQFSSNHCNVAHCNVMGLLLLFFCWHTLSPSGQEAHFHIFFIPSGKPRRGWWHPTPVLLPGKSHGRRSLVGCSPWGREESDTTERPHFHFSLSCIGEGNRNPLQCSCLENPRDGGAWWAALYGVAQSRTRLKLLSRKTWRQTYGSTKESCWMNRTNRQCVITRHQELC